MFWVKSALNGWCAQVAHFVKISASNINFFCDVLFILKEVRRHDFNLTRYDTLNLGTSQEFGFDILQVVDEPTVVVSTGVE